MTNWTSERHAAAKARCEAATDGPWGWDFGSLFGHNAETLLEADTLFDPEREDLDFIAAAREDLPDALTAIEARDAEIERLRANGWHSVADDLPDVGAVVMVWLPGAEGGEEWRAVYKPLAGVTVPMDWFSDPQSSQLDQMWLQGVTHWRLPTPGPKGGAS